MKIEIKKGKAIEHKNITKTERAFHEFSEQIRILMK